MEATIGRVFQKVSLLHGIIFYTDDFYKFPSQGIIVVIVG